MDKALYNYRVVPTSITHIFNVNTYKNTTIVRGTLLEYIQKLHMDTEENMLIFYKFYIRTMLHYIVKLGGQDEYKKEIIEIFDEIKNFQLYLDALDYINVFTIPFKYKTLFFLFNKSYYRLVFLWIPIINFIREKLNK